MKRIYFYLSILFCVFASGLLMVSCSEDDELGVNEGLSVKVYSPTKVIPGQEVVISGTGLSFVTSVVFPGGVSSSDIEVVNGGMIKVKTPAGIDVNGGELVVNAGTESVTAHIPMTVGNPQINIMNPSDKANVGDELTITGEDMEFFSKAYFPAEDGGEVIVNAIDFNRKSTSQLRLSVPRGIAEGMAAIRLEACDGKQYTLPEIELSATVPGYWETQEVIVWEGEEDMNSWGNNWSVKAAWFEGVEVGTEITFHFEVYADFAQFKTENGEWGAITIPEWGNQTVTTQDLLAEGVTSLSFVLTEDLMNPWFTTGDSWGNGDAIIIHGEGMKFTKISYTKEVFIEGDGPVEQDIVLWEGDFKIQWSDDGKIVIPYEMFADMKAGTVLYFQYDQIDQTWAQAQVNYGNFQTINFTEGEVTFNGTLVPTDVYGWEFDSRITPVVITQEILDGIHANHKDFYGTDAGIIIQGSDLIFKKIYYTVVTGGGGGAAAETIIWEGEEDLGSWSLNYEVKPNTAFVDAGVAAGMSMSIYVDAYEEGAKIQLFNGHWERLFGDIELIPEDGVITVPIDDALAANLVEYIDWGYCMIVQGQGCVLKKIAIK